MDIYHIDMVILDIDVGYGLMIWGMTVSIWLSWISIWDMLSLWRPALARDMDEVNKNLPGLGGFMEHVEVFDSSLFGMASTAGAYIRPLLRISAQPVVSRF